MKIAGLPGRQRGRHRVRNPIVERRRLEIEPVLGEQLPRKIDGEERHDDAGAKTSTLRAERRGSAASAGMAERRTRNMATYEPRRANPANGMISDAHTSLSQPTKAASSMAPLRPSQP